MAVIEMKQSIYIFLTDTVPFADELLGHLHPHVSKLLLEPLLLGRGECLHLESRLDDEPHHQLKVLTPHLHTHRQTNGYTHTDVINS